MMKVKNTQKKKKIEIHCPISGCLYAEGSERHFTEKRFFDQHFAKVHAEKKFVCSKCQKGFGLLWLMKNHEKTCGMIWKCRCGVQYHSRETLLTHLRRTDHKPLDSMVMEKNMKKKKETSKLSENPVVLLIQPIIQNISLMMPPNNASSITPRILPKTTQPLFFSLPVQTVTSTPVSMSHNNSAAVLQPTSETLLNPTQSETPRCSQDQEEKLLTGSVTDVSKNEQRTVSTQTTDETTLSANHRQSQASQCSRRRPKSLKVGIESQTQTAESAVTKIKKRRTRRKSVAIVTDTSMLTDQILGPDNVYWPGFRDFVLQHAESLGACLFKNTTSTQTSSTNCSKTVCDSETLTDNELAKAVWDESFNLQYQNKPGDQLQTISDNQNVCMALSNKDSNPQRFDIFTGEKLNSYDEHSNVNAIVVDPMNSLTSIISENDPKSGTDARSKSESCIYDDSSGNACSQQYSVFSTYDKPSFGDKISDSPALTDIHTQTIASEILDYNLLTNMETQTTDDFNFSYLEFSDTETQTPWGDFLSAEDSPLNTDQLSIEIQTDFSLFDSKLNLDPYEFMNSFDLQNRMSGGTSKESAGVSTETQTLDQLYFPQVTNSESQTLDIPSFMFDS